MYKIAYIDESKGDRDSFQDYAKYAASAQYFELEVIEPEHPLDDFVVKLFEGHYQAFIIDFFLSEKNSKIKFDGWLLAERILEVRENFPIFILTAHEDDALKGSDDVNIVYEKNKIVHGEDDDGFLEKVILQIEKYEKRIKKVEQRILALLDVQKSRALTCVEEDELFDKSIIIEKALNKTAAIPKNLQSQSGEKHLDDILSLLQKMEVDFKEHNKNKK
jgi:hypothetical protein